MEQGKWIKSTRSPQVDACVEVMWTGDGYLVRDSKNPDGPVLSFNRREWDAFVEGAKGGEFDI